MNRTIIFINSISGGGAERVVSRLFSNAKFSNDKEIWTLSDAVSYEIDSSIVTSYRGGSTLSTILKIIYNLKGLDSTDFIQCHLNRPILFTSLAHFINNKFHYQAVHCFAYSSYFSRKGLVGSLKRRFFGFLLKQVDSHIFKSIEMVGDFYQCFGWLPSSYTVINNPYDIQNIESLAKEDIDASELSQKKLNRSSNVAVVGRLDKSKRVLDVLKLASRLSDDVVFHLFGEGRQKAELLEYCKQEGVTNVVFHGNVNNPFKYVRQCGLYLSCSEAEGFPNAAVEAMICGAIVIHSDCKTGPKEILFDHPENVRSFHEKSFYVGQRGILFKVGDIEGALKALEYALANSSELQARFQASISKFTTSLSLQSISNKYDEYIRVKRD
ncbi:glycosyltransferase [Vibrio maritimus]|uniref:glycosyltransferase n=1 Tax=Vibrio maritimus TaxID=990268 RepID=UPI0037354E8D